MIKLGECVVCAESCCWITADGDLYEKEACSHNHLEYLETWGDLLASQAVSQSAQQVNAAELLPSEANESGLTSPAARQVSDSSDLQSA